jgi:hypothetical protein
MSMVAMEMKQSMERKQAKETIQALVRAMEATTFERLCIHDYALLFVFVMHNDCRLNLI